MPDQQEIRALLLEALELDVESLKSRLAGSAAFAKALELPETEPPQGAVASFKSMGPRESVERIVKAIEKSLSESGESLHDLICHKFDYCHHKFDAELKLLTFLIAHSVLVHVVFHGVSLPVLAGAVAYLHKNSFFDKLCDCEKRK
jgi:hypothetical protein